MMKHVFDVRRLEPSEPEEAVDGRSEEIAWMGYVGALAGLVIGLLLMIAVVGVGIGILGRSALAPSGVSAASTPAGVAVPLRSVAQPSGSADAQAVSAWPPAPQKRSSAQRSAPATVASAASVVTPAGAAPAQSIPLAEAARPAVVLALRFSAGEVAMDAASRQALAEEARARQSQVQADMVWLLMALSEPDDARHQRLSYLRLLALRNVLLDVGIAAVDIRSELLPQQDLPSPSADVVYVALARNGR